MKNVMKTVIRLLSISLILLNTILAVLLENYLLALSVCVGILILLTLSNDKLFCKILNIFLLIKNAVIKQFQNMIAVNRWYTSALLYTKLTNKKRRKHMNKNEYIENLEAALIDVLDGNSKWYEIQKNTGLSEERCKEIEAFFQNLVMETCKNKHNL